MRIPARTLRLLLVTVGLAFGACSDDASQTSDSGAPDSGAPDTGDAAPEPLLGDIAVAENPSNALSFFVDWTTDRPATATLEVDCGEPLDEVFEGDELRLAHRAFVMGLVVGAQCDLRVTVRDEQGTEESGTATFDATDTLPSFLHDLTINVYDPELVQPGWTLFNIVDLNESYAYMAMADAQGRYRWYHRRGLRAWDLTVIPEGLLAGGMAEKSVILDWDGTVLWVSPFVSHHDVRPSPWNDGYLLWLGYTRENCPRSTREDTVNEHDLESDATVWTWNVCDYYVPEVIRVGWSHINTVEPVPGERAMILSPRDQSLLFKVDRDTGEIIWRLGIGGDFEMDEEDIFYFQHAPEIQPNGNILLYDNGHDPERVVTRVIELALSYDEEGDPLRAEVVWEYVDETLFTRARGDADRLANGNTLITYGGIDPELPQPTNPPTSSRLREVTPDGTIAWDLETPSQSAAYRADRVEPRFGELR